MIAVALALFAVLRAVSLLDECSGGVRGRRFRRQKTAVSASRYCADADRGEPVSLRFQPHRPSVVANVRTSRITSASFDRNIYRLAPGSSTIRASGTPARKSLSHFSSIPRPAT